MAANDQEVQMGARGRIVGSHIDGNLLHGPVERQQCAAGCPGGLQKAGVVGVDIAGHGEFQR